MVALIAFDRLTAVVDSNPQELCYFAPKIESITPIAARVISGKT